LSFCRNFLMLIHLFAKMLAQKGADMNPRNFLLMISIGTGLCLLPSRMQAAGLYFTGDHATENLTITAKEGDGEQYWKMVVSGGTAPGRILEFYDLTGEGNSSSSFNCAHNYSFGQGMLDPVDNRQMRNAGRWTLVPGTATDGVSSYTYTLRRDEISGGYTNVITMTWTIEVPSPSGTQVVVVNNWFFPEGWPSANNQCRAQGWVGLYSAEYSDTGSPDEYTMSSYNGPGAAGTGTQRVQFVVKAGVPNMAEGRIYKATHAAAQFDLAYDAVAMDYVASGDYWGTPGGRGYYDLGVTGVWGGNPGTVPAGGINYVSTTTLEVNIVAPPSTGSEFIIQ